MAAPLDEAILLQQLKQQICAAVDQIFPTLKAYTIAGIPANEGGPAAERLELVYQRRLSRALERNRQVALWVEAGAPPFIALPAAHNENPPAGILEIFPTTRDELTSLSGENLNRILGAYGLPVTGSSSTKKIRLMAFLTNGPA